MILDSIPVQFNINGSEVQDNVDGETTLLTYLRESPGLYGAKNGCGQGQCGTCTVLVNGRNITRDLRGSGISKAGDAPEIVNITVEVPHLQGPLGAKGFAEAPSLATAPAVVNAIYDAIGVRMYHLPMTPKRVKAATERAL